MVVAGKIFKLTEQMALSDIASKLSNHKKEEQHEEAEYKFTLITEVVQLRTSESSLRGIYSHDYVTHVFHRGKVLPLPRTVEALFSFSQHDNRTLLTVVERKIMANFIANRLGEVIYERTLRLLKLEFHLRL